MNGKFQDSSFLVSKASKSLLVTCGILAILYFCAIAFLFPISNNVLFWVLVGTEVFHMWQAFTFWHTIWDTEAHPEINEVLAAKFQPEIDVFITVCGEPVDIVEETVMAARAMNYPSHHIYVLNDGYVAKKDNWKEIELMAKRLGVRCITRQRAGGAKAGNINNALRLTKNPFVVVFDADHVPHPDFLEKTVPYFIDEQMGWVQTPQYYRNYDLNYVTAGAWEQQTIFFGPIMKGKNKYNAAFMCGTNMVIRRSALEQVGGLDETNIAEDFATSVYLHQLGWKSYYLPELLTEGLAPEDFLSYYKQQYRWARGSLQIIFKHNPFFVRGLTFAQRLQYSASASFYLSGVVVLINALLPLIFFFTGLTPFRVPTMILAAIFLPYIFLTIYTLSLSTNFTYTYRAVGFSLSQFSLHIRAIFSILTGKKDSFSVTSKRALQGNFVNLVIPHISYGVLVVVGVAVAVLREGLSAAVITNIGWALINCIIFAMFVVAALPILRGSPARTEKPEAESLVKEQLIKT